jgi:elongator complex protein 6
MRASSRIPHDLQPYVNLQKEGSLILLTSVLGASTNWLLIRFLCAAFAEFETSGLLKSAGEPELARQSDDTVDSHRSQLEDDVSVVFLSFLRDWEFWKVEARRVGVSFFLAGAQARQLGLTHETPQGLDLSKLAQQKRFAFIDGLAALAPSEPRRTTKLPEPTVPRPAPQSPAVQSSTIPSGYFPITSMKLQNVEDAIQQALSYIQTKPVSSSRRKRVLLVLDSPDVLLASANPQTDKTNPSTLNTMVLQYHRQVHTTVVSLAADMPLTSTGEAPTPLESNHAALVSSIAHVSSYILSLRLLDTGFAADVSGVMRITRGAFDEESEEPAPRDSRTSTDKELLYYIRGDGTATAFARGARMDTS